MQVIFHCDAIFLHLTFQQNHRFADQLRKIHGTHVITTVASHGKHGIRDLGGSFTRGQNLCKCFIPCGLVFVTNSHFGVIKDRHQHIVELMGRGPDKFSNRGLFLSLKELLFKLADLLLKLLVGQLRHDLPALSARFRSYGFTCAKRYGGCGS